VTRVEQSLSRQSRRLHYLSIPPSSAHPVVQTLGDAGLVERSRIIMEKPFGTNLESARVLNDTVHGVFSPEKAYRIDHFLGKEAAQNIPAFRFANGPFEPIWNRNHIDHVQIDVPETLPVDSRAAFYEGTGVFRDMVVTHLFQVLASMALEPPTSLEPRSISEEKNKVFRSMRPIDVGRVVRGQYEGYRSIPGMAEGPDTETFIALRCEIDNWRWAGVPFYLRTGKNMAPGGPASSPSPSGSRPSPCSRRTREWAPTARTTSPSTWRTPPSCRSPSTGSVRARACSWTSSASSSPCARPATRPTSSRPTNG
jgi:glucose-6-phosphate 1-dehydrogenase